MFEKCNKYTIQKFLFEFNTYANKTAKHIKKL